MSFGIKCDLCGTPVGVTESVSAFRMWNGVRCVEIEQEGLNHIAFDECFYVCDECFEKAHDLLLKVEVVER